MTRYARNLQLPGFTEETQQKLAGSRVLIVGAGALGSVVGMYLAASGVGNISIADFDNIEMTNLQRQVFYDESEVGKPKAEILAKKISALNCNIKVEAINRFITPSTVEPFVSGKSVVVECSDNPSTKEMIVKSGKESGVPVVVGGVREYAGQVMVFGSDSPDYNDIFLPPECSSVLPCGASGVFGPLPGIVGCMQAAEVVKIIGNLPGILYDTLLTFDLMTMDFRKFGFSDR